MPKNEIEEGKLVAILAYLLIGIIWYFADEKMKKNEFVKFHVKQALVLLIVDVLGYAILGIIIIIGWVLMPIFGVVMLILWIIGIINALNGKKKALPIIGGFAKKFTF